MLLSITMTEQYRPQETQPTSEQLLKAGGELLQHFGVEADPVKNPDEFRAALKQLDPRYQGGRNLVRWQLEADQTEWDEPTKDIIMRTAESMRMLEAETPLQGDFDAVIVLGGARQSNLDRTNYAVEAIKGGKANVKQLIVAGSSRELNEAEQENTANYAPGAKTEFDLCVGAAATASKENPGLVASVMYVEDKRAGTPAVIENVLATLQANGTLPEGSKVAAVTTQIYQTSTERDLDRVAKQFGVAETFTAGNPSDPNVVANRTPATYLSEVLRTLKAATNAAQAEKEYAKAELEASDQRVEAATGAKETVVHQSADGGRTVEDERGNLYVVEPDGSRWISYSSTSGLSYMGPNDLVGYYSE
jgi:hypothetical protein